MTGDEQRTEMDQHDTTLAIDGGTPVISQGPPPWPPLDENVRAALLAAYEDGSWGRYEGPHCRRLASRLAEMHAVEHVTLCSSGTVAVELALRGLGVAAGDEVILAGYDFPGNFRAVEAVGAIPVLVDIDPRTWSLDPVHLAGAVNRLTRAIVASHLHGGLVPMQRLTRQAGDLGVRVVEDACQAPGATVDGQLAGTWGDVAVFSFGGSKLLTAGRGGAMLTRYEEVHQRAKVFAKRGNDAFPLSELQAAVLAPQLDRLASRNRRRRQSADELSRALSDSNGLDGVVNQDGAMPSYYKIAWLYDAASWGGTPRDEFLSIVQAEGVALNEGFRGFTRRSSRRCRRMGELPYSTRAAEGTVLLHHPVLLEQPHVVRQVAEAIHKVHAALVNRR